MSVPKIAATLSLVGALALASYGPAQSAPLTALSAAAKPDAQQSDAVQVRYWGGGWRGGGWGGWRGGGWGGGWRGGGWGLGLAAGAVIGAAIATPYYYGGGYYPSAGYGYGYGYPYYSTPYYGYTAGYYPAYGYGYYRPYYRY